jgi:hypothetical protein
MDMDMEMDKIKESRSQGRGLCAVAHHFQLCRARCVCAEGRREMGRRVWLCRFGAFSLYAEERSATLGAWVLQRTNISRENCNRGRRLSFFG